jgi:nucleoid DNA-binding protein
MDELTMDECALQMAKYVDKSVNPEDLKTFTGALTDVLIEELTKKKGKVTLPGLGTFRSVLLEAVDTRHPCAGKICAPEKRIFEFKPAGKLKKAIRRADEPHRSRVAGAPGIFARIFKRNH